jgi:hypothetical protein
MVNSISVYFCPPKVNTLVFPNFASGFADTTLIVREHTLRAMVHLILLAVFLQILFSNDNPDIILQ